MVSMRAQGSSLLLAFMLFTGGVSAQDQSATVSTFNEGVSLLKAGKTDEALTKLKSILESAPSEQEIFNLFKQTGNDAWLRMLAQEGEVEKVARQLLALANSGRKERSDNAEAIRSLMDKLYSEDFLVRRKATLMITANHGEYAIPHLLPKISSAANPETRFTMINVLTEMAGDAVLPLAAALNTSDDTQIRSIVTILGNIRDYRALPALKDVAMNAKDSQTRSMAQSVVSSMGRWIQQASVSDLYSMLGEGYLTQDPTVVRTVDLANSIWSYSDKAGLTRIQVPSELHHLEIARNAFVSAVNADPQSEKANQGLIRTLAAQLEASKGLGGDEFVAAVGKRAELQLAAAGAIKMNPSALPAIQNQNASGSVVEAAFGETATKTSPNYVATLIEGTQSADSRVRFASAIALAQHQTQMKGEVGANVIEILGEAARQKSLLVVHVVDANHNRRDAQAQTIQQAGMHAVPASSNGIGMILVKKYGSSDLILINTGNKDISLEQTLTELKTDTRTKDIPVILTAPKKQLETIQEAHGAHVAAVIDQAAALDMNQITETAESHTNPNRNITEQLSKEAAMALLNLEVGADQLSGTASSLMTCAEIQKDDIAIPAVMALGKAGTITETAGLATILQDNNRSENLRVVTALALGQILARTQEAPSAVVKTLQACMKTSESGELQRAAATALGTAASIQANDKAGIFTP